MNATRIRRLLTSLGEALDALARDEAPRAALGEVLANEYNGLPLTGTLVAPMTWLA